MKNEFEIAIQGRKTGELSAKLFSGLLANRGSESSGQVGSNIPIPGK